MQKPFRAGMCLCPAMPTALSSEGSIPGQRYFSTIFDGNKGIQKKIHTCIPTTRRCRRSSFPSPYSTHAGAHGMDLFLCKREYVSMKLVNRLFLTKKRMECTSPPNRNHLCHCRVPQIPDWLAIPNSRV